jgi:hypothetical protein
LDEHRPFYGKKGNLSQVPHAIQPLQKSDLPSHRGHSYYRKFDGEFFNLFNHPSFHGVGTTVGAATFGKITSVLDPRNIAFKLKFSF